VRLYSEKTLTQAKTSIPGMGLPITSVDVTFDGGWVMARGGWMAGWRAGWPGKVSSWYGVGAFCVHPHSQFCLTH